MKLIGMLDSPLCAARGRFLPVAEHSVRTPSLSVFSAFDEFSGINPVVKAPTLVADDGTVLMESGLILELGERMAGAGLSLAPTDIGAFARAQRIIGLALAACEKTVQIVYENNLRPAERRHQLGSTGYWGNCWQPVSCWKRKYDRQTHGCSGARPLQADITSAVAFRFMQEMLPDVIAHEAYPALAALSANAEATKPFCAFPFG